MPFFNFTEARHQNATYHTDVILPTHRKASKRRRKKERNKKRHRNRQFYANIDDYLTLTDSSYGGKSSKTKCKDCKIRKRKGRNRQYVSRMNTSVLRKIMERVADDTLSGARSGDGTLGSLMDSEVKTTSNRKEKTQVNRDGSKDTKNWGSSQNWLNLATQTGYRIDGNILSTGKHKRSTVWISGITWQTSLCNVQLQFTWKRKAFQFSVLITRKKPTRHQHVSDVT